MPDIIAEMSKVVFRNMGAPREFSDFAFRKAFRKELDARKLDKDLAQYRYLHGQVIRRVRAFIRRPPKNLPAAAPPPADYKKLAANDID
jgi:hypothetical protein